MSYLLDSKYLAYKVFNVADIFHVGINFIYLPFDETAANPRFKKIAKYPLINEVGHIIYYTNQGHYNGKHILIIKSV